MFIGSADVERVVSPDICALLYSQQLLCECCSHSNHVVENVTNAFSGLIEDYANEIYPSVLESGAGTPGRVKLQLYNLFIGYVSKRSFTIFVARH